MSLLPIFVSLLLTLLVNELMDWSTQLSEVVIRISANILPSSLQERYTEEFLGDIDDTNGRLCKVLRSIVFVVVALKMRHELHAEFAGYYKYALYDPKQHLLLKGVCHVKSSFFKLSVHGCLKEVIDESDLLYQHIEYVKIPWNSNSANIIVNYNNKPELKIDYSIIINDEEINGEFSVNVDEDKNMAGHLNREPIKNGLFLLRRI